MTSSWYTLFHKRDFGMAIGEQIGRNERVVFDDHNFKEVAERLSEQYAELLYYPEHNPDATKRLKDQIATWQNNGSTVIFTSGVYDLLHHDHKGYLLHTKLAGAATHYQKKHADTGRFWSELPTGEKRQISDTYLANGELRLVVSVDGDMSVAKRKGDKGGAARPITGWLTRARSVADVTYPLRTNNGWERRTIADAVTIHGPEDFASDSPHASILTLAETLQPDVWTVFEESIDILETAPYVPALGSVALTCIAAGGDFRYFTDSIIGKFSTTALLSRMAENS